MQDYTIEEKENLLVNDLIKKNKTAGIVLYLVIFIFVSVIGLITYFYVEKTKPVNVIIENNNELKTENFVYGSWPALENIDFFEKTKQSFIDQKIDFIEANLSSMKINVYKKGELKTTAPIQTKGKEGSWWETPAGLYQVNTKEINHFSTFGYVNMPWSMQFQGNFFIHGPTTYPNGEPTSSTYSGGCIRLSLEDSEEIYKMVDEGTPILVFEDSFEYVSNQSSYTNKNLLDKDTFYLVADLENNFVFSENNSDKKHSIASITKLMSALVAVEHINVEKEVLIREEMIATTSIQRLEVGDRLSILDLLSVMLQESSNEASIAIMNPLGENRFINFMNEKAKAIGMKNTTFADASGVLSANISTPEDLFQLAKYLYYNRSFILHMTMGEEDRGLYNSSKYSDLNNLNEITGIEKIVGAKTGLSTSAGDSIFAVLNMEIDKKERPIFITILGSKDAKSDLLKLVKFIDVNFSVNKPNEFSNN